MKKALMLSRTAFLVLGLLLFCGCALSYVPHAPIETAFVETTPDDPYVIEGYEITNPGGPCIKLERVENVIIRDNYIHDCGTEVSEELQEKVRKTGDARNAMMTDPFKTGGIMVFDSETAEIYDNEVINNDFGIRVWGHNVRPERVSIHDNTVKNNHRSFFVSVSNADNVDIYNNYVKDNGLDLFYDNEGLAEAFAKGEDFGDGRTQGITTNGCDHVRIFNNTILNSSSDGIGVVGADEETSYDVEIFNNVVMWNGEQGIWLVDVEGGKIHHNIVRENRHRLHETGGSSGINFEEGVSGFEIFSNDIGYNDIFGIYLVGSPDNEIYDNEIHHNGDGAFGFGDLFHFERQGKGSTSNTIIRDNYVHHNRKNVFEIWAEDIGDVTVEDNIFESNGGNPIHYEQYEDFNTSAHPEDWEYEDESVMLNPEDKGFIEKFQIGTNTIDGQEVTGSFEVTAEKWSEKLKKEPEKKEIEKEIEKEEEPGKTELCPERECRECEECNTTPEKVYAVLFFITLILLIVFIVKYFRKKR